jgi:holliday junction DNA helicase RuvA
MIGSVRGELIHRTPAGEVTVEAAGVGYRVTMAPPSAQAIGRIHDNVFVWTHHVVREDSERLFGFVSVGERDTFEALLAAQGVGPALALAILSVHSPTALRAVLASSDLDALCLVPGVGKKTATKLLVELKSRMDLGEVDIVELTGGINVATGAISEVRTALIGLGYSTDEVKHAVADLSADGDTSALLRQALLRLGSKR